jgi:membrane protein DedA with SNARE-associated domain
MDPLADLIEWVAVYGIVGLLSIGLAERFVPALPSHGVLVAIGIAASEDVWSVQAAVIGTALGSFVGALGLYLLARAVGERKSVGILYAIGKRIGISRHRIDLSISSLRAREQSLTITSQLIPTIRLIAPVTAAVLGTSVLRFASGLVVGILLWNGVYILAGYVAVMALPDINSSGLALKVLGLLVVVEVLIAVVSRLQFPSFKRAWSRGDPK